MITAKDLTLEEKFLLLTGRDMWRLTNANGKLPEIFMCDGPSGLRMEILDENGEKTGTIPATAMPTISQLANSWNRETVYLNGKTIADEYVEHGAHINLAPGVNIKRSPLCGRNFEYFSEDPYLAGTLSYEYIKGVQDKGIGTSLKHFCANNKESYRVSASSEVDERTLREIYLTPFEMALKAKPWTVMCSYNLINGVYASENKKLLKNVLRDEFGFDGVIMSDWGAVGNRYKALKATLDLQMPHHRCALPELKDAYEKGLITDEEIDYCVNNIIDLIYKCHSQNKKVEYTKEQRHQNAVEIAKEGVVMLKNDNDLLPIKGKKVMVVTADGPVPRIGGTGSANVSADFKFIKLSDLLQQKDPTGSYKPVYSLNPIYTECAEMDAVLITCFAEAEGEAYDRTSLQISKFAIECIEEISKRNKNIILLVYAGSAIETGDWLDKVSSLIYCGFGGEGIDQALASIITGEVSPSGKLAETFPVSLDQASCKFNQINGFLEDYSEKLMVGYRYYDTYNKQVGFPFGYGLSYAKFEYSDMQIKKLGDTDFEVSYTITNTSNIDAKEVSELYVKHILPRVIRPEKELKGFSKDLIKAGESKRITLKLDFRSFAYYNVSLDAWHVENATYEIMVGASSRDIKLTQKIKIERADETQNSTYTHVIGS